jgi:hypothetical protein
MVLINMSHEIAASKSNVGDVWELILHASLKFQHTQATLRQSAQTAWLSFWINYL